MKFLNALAAAGLTVALLACSVPPNLTATNSPTVVIQYRASNGQYVTGANPNLPSQIASQYVVGPNPTLPIQGASTLKILCTVKDPGGVVFVGVTFNRIANSCNDGLTPSSGDTYVIPELPEPAFQTVQPNAQGKLPDTAFILTTIKGPFSCNIPGVGKSTLPIGTVLTATCLGQNASKNPGIVPTTAVLPITLQ